MKADAYPALKIICPACKERMQEQIGVGVFCFTPRCENANKFFSVKAPKVAVELTETEDGHDTSPSFHYY